jgi:hypothetical protein
MFFGSLACGELDFRALNVERRKRFTTKSSEGMEDGGGKRTEEIERIEIAEI